MYIYEVFCRGSMYIYEGLTLGVVIMSEAEVIQELLNNAMRAVEFSEFQNKKLKAKVKLYEDALKEISVENGWFQEIAYEALAAGKKI